jgi:phospholipid/cholesterol/gamma-HCH transport system permease protein
VTLKALGILELTGRSFYDLLRYVGGLGGLLLDGIWWMTLGPLRGKGRIRREDTFFQMAHISVWSFAIVSLVIFFVGMILTFQMAYVLKTLGVVRYVADIIGVAMVREMGPLIVGMVMTGYTGAAIAAEIGTMVVSEEVTALEAAALHPVRFLVVPRLLAGMVMMPLVTMVAIYVGISGGFVIAVNLLDLDKVEYVRRTLDTLTLKDVLTGLIKAEVFGALIALIACHEGFSVAGGAEGVGRATTNAVVRSIVAIIVSDLIFTTIFFYFL